MTETAAASQHHNKKRKRSSAIPDANTTAASTSAGTKHPKPTSKKPTSKKPRVKETKPSQEPTPTDAKKESVADADGEEGAEAAAENKNSRFIVFIGNLPYTATTASLTSHFSAVQPISVRVITDKTDQSKCKGFAFLEFEGYDRMKSCLAKFHHTMFNDGVSEARKINVELTAGGGGKSKARQSKLQAKNEKLNEQRRRRMQEEEKLRQEKSDKRAQSGGGGNSGLHPSRRNRVE
ncbi:hypothetical protein RUND412_008752 [Rhizina undulata]